MAWDLKCAGLAASGLSAAAVVAAWACRAKKPSWPSSADSASPANPAPISHTNSRRVSPQGNSRRPPASARLVDDSRFIASLVSSLTSVDVNKLVEIQQHVAQRRQRLRLGVFVGQRFPTGLRRARPDSAAAPARCSTARRVRSRSSGSRKGPATRPARLAARASSPASAPHPRRKRPALLVDEIVVQQRQRLRSDCRNVALGCTGCVVSAKSNVVISGNSSDRLVIM